MGHKMNLTFLLKPSCLTSLGLHALVIFYFSQNTLTTTVPSSGLPQVQRVSLKAVPVPTKKPEIEKVTPKPVVKKAKSKPIAAPIEKTPKKTAQESATKLDKEYPNYAPTPHYPRLARVRGLEGEVIIKVAVNPAGVPVKTSLVRSSGHPVLDNAALEGLKKWRFGPTSEITQTIAFTTQKTVKFQLQ
jgi:protein TonB